MKRVIALWVNFKQAFNRVLQEGLAIKLWRWGIYDTMMRWTQVLKSMLKHKHRYKSTHNHRPSWGTQYQCWCATSAPWMYPQRVRGGLQESSSSWAQRQTGWTWEHYWSRSLLEQGKTEKCTQSKGMHHWRWDIFTDSLYSKLSTTRWSPTSHIIKTFEVSNYTESAVYVIVLTNKCSH